jgi:hypothetical protein
MINTLSLLVHATHEAAVKVGGIGAVLDGMLGADAYNHHVKRTVLVGPLNAADNTEMERLLSRHNGLTVRYSSLHAIFDGVPEAQRRALQQIEQTFAVALFCRTVEFWRALLCFKCLWLCWLCRTRSPWTNQRSQSGAGRLCQLALWSLVGQSV